jgi:hypothetical protein
MIRLALNIRRIFPLPPDATFVFVPIGPNNIITSSGKYSGQQPTVFPAGTGQFKIYFDGSKTTWTLTTYNGNHNSSVAAVASSTSSKCSSGGTTLQTVMEPSIQESTAEAADPASVIYPNPVKDLVTIYVKSATLLSAKIQVIDTYGKSVVKRKKINENSLVVDEQTKRRYVFYPRYGGQ